MQNLLFTFQDQETGNLRSILAPDESAARLALGGVWTQVGRTVAWTPCEIGGLQALLEEAQAEERAAHAAVLAANPMGKDNFTMPEALAEFTAAKERHRKAQARCSELAPLAGNG
jgi:hypothetical protein